MGQISSPSSSGFPRIVAIDRLKASNAGAGQSGNRVFMVGQDTGKNSTLSDLVLVGNTVFGQGITDARLTGTVALGSMALAALTAGTNNELAVGGIVAIGRGVMQSAQFAGSMVAIGDKVLNLHTGSVANAGPTRSVVIGTAACSGFSGNAQFDSNVIIGYHALLGGGSVLSSSANVLIGYGVAENAQNAVNTNVVIGNGACPNLGTSGSASNNVVLGNAAGSLDIATDNTIIGASAGLSGGNLQNVLIGKSSVANGDNNTQLGYGTTSGGGGAGSNNISIGFSAGINNPVTSSLICAIESYTAGFSIPNAVLYSDMSQGNIILGNSVQGTNRDWRGTTQPTNAVKLLNGTVGTGTNPIGGGFLYVSAGALHWKGSGGTDTVIAPA